MHERWPDLNYQAWKPTYETLHRWLQIVGKLRVCKSPWLNHSWNSTFVVTSRGLSTTAIPLGNRILTIDFDFINHDLIFHDITGRDFVMSLQHSSADRMKCWMQLPFMKTLLTARIIRFTLIMLFRSW